MPEAEPLPLVVRNLSFRYRSRSTPAIKDISLELHPGEVMLLAGSSGCGKTTLMRCINGLIPHAYHGELSGEILLYGQSNAGMKLAEISQKWARCCKTPRGKFWAVMCSTKFALGWKTWACHEKK